MRPQYVIHLGLEAFQGATAACEGGQLAHVLEAIGDVRPDLSWYIADVQTIGHSPAERREARPEVVGNTSALIRAVATVEQFESGVFAGVPQQIVRPTFRSGGLWTEDDEAADLCDAVVELRAFDSTYLSIATSDTEIARRITEVFGKQPE